MSGLELEQDLTFSRRTWTVQRVSWGVGLLLVLLAAAGLFGRGPLAWDTAEADGLQVEFERQTHSPATTIVHVPAKAAPAGDEFTLWIDRSYFDSAKLVRMTPRPLRTAISDQRVEYVVQRSGGGTVRLVLEFEMRKASALDARLGISGGPAVEFRQFVLP